MFQLCFERKENIYRKKQLLSLLTEHATGTYRLHYQQHKNSALNTILGQMNPTYVP
jgi:hypothetical protein